MFENPPETPRVQAMLNLSCKQQQALRWYGQSITDFQISLSKTPQKEQTDLALLSCILLSTVQFQQNNVANAARLLNKGHEIAGHLAQSMVPSKRALSSDVQDILIPMLARQNVLMSMFGYHTSQQWLKIFETLTTTSSTNFTSFTQARTALYACACKAVEFISKAVQHRTEALTQPAPSDGSILYEQQSNISHEFVCWDRAFQAFCKRTSRQHTVEDQLTISTMIMHCKIAQIWTIICLDEACTEIDKQFPLFEDIIAHAEAVVNAQSKWTDVHEVPTFSFELGIIPPLYFTAITCRHPLLRRRAVELMRKAPKQEALFSAELNTKAAEKVISLEESEELSQMVANGTWDGTVPSREQRCQYITLHFEGVDGEKKRPALLYVRETTCEKTGAVRLVDCTANLYDDELDIGCSS